MAKVTLTIEIDSIVNDELDYIVKTLQAENNYYADSKEKAIAYLCESWADAGRRPGSWERGTFQALGLVPDDKNFNHYRHYYGDPKTVKERYTQYCEETGQDPSRFDFGYQDKKMSDKKKTALTIRIDDDLLQAFKKACDDKDYSQSLVIRELIKKWLVDKKQGDLLR